MRRHSSAVLAFALVWAIVVMSGAPAPAPAATPNPNVGCHVRGALPDPACTPGAVATTDRATICAAHYASDERSVTTAEKNAVYAEYGITDHAGFVVDHDVPLELGGSNDIKNLWPEPVNAWPGAKDKDLLEASVHRAVCDGRVSPIDGQRWFETDWRTVFIEPAVGT